ncbi:predicted protein [Naegleria gruberi]|uniref:Predicted protein n=1 Tax=Naegleria gruberi TaxID=5762 RepID=D2VG64_NAEGR|nr:uncharacterized protein NAEGRDRAFT_67867 [Naegleria gruberi]EFC44217.1 predicted protein [Naegleria gruberi]|eukprot:XP_002676961.1 predicted protein [Naegleria gruberi strain NEG-M]
MSYWEKSMREGVASSFVFFMELIRNLYVSIISLVSYGYRRRNLYKIYRKFGREKAIYLSFQLHLLWISLLCSIIVCAVLLPLHLTGREIDNSEYAYNIVALTSALRAATSPVKMFAHVAILIVFIIITLVFMVSFNRNRFSSSLLLVGEDSNSTEQDSTLSNDETVIISPFTIVLDGIPKESSQKSVEQFIEENFNGGLSANDENSKIVKIFHVPNLVDRLNLKELEEHLERELEHFMHLKGKSNYDVAKRHIVHEMRPLYSDDLRFKLCGCTTYSTNLKTMTTDEAVEYLRLEYSDCKRMVEQWDGEYTSMFLTDERQSQDEEYLSQIKQVKSSGKCFIVFKKVEHVDEAIEKNRIMFNDSSVSLMKLLIEPQDINWHFIGGTSKYFSLRNFCMISLIFFVLLVFSGPPSILQSLQALGSPILKAVKLGDLSDLLFHYCPSLLIFIFSKLFPIFFKKITQTEKHLSKSFYSRILLVRLFTFSILNILILPGLWIISAFLFLVFANDGKHLDIMFLPKTIETMISTLLQFMVMENVYELVRFGKTLYYIWKTTFNCYRKARTPTQILKLIKETKEFDMEENVSNMLGILCMSMVYSFCCPLVMPLAFLCIFIKHWFDRCVIEEEFTHHSNINEKDDKLDFTSSLRLSKLLIVLVLTTLSIVGMIVILGFSYLFFTSLMYIIHLGVCGACLAILLLITLALIFKQNSSVRSNKKDIAEQQERMLDPNSFSQQVQDILNVENILKF